MEILGFEPGLENSYYGAEFRDQTNNRVGVVYETLHDDDEEPLYEQAPYRNVRPYPARIEAQLSPGDEVDVWFNDGWWQGRYRRYDADNSEGLPYHVHFNYMTKGQRFGNFQRDDIRLHQDFRFDDHVNFNAVWTYQKT